MGFNSGFKGLNIWGGECSDNWKV